MGTEEAFRAVTADNLQYGMGKKSLAAKINARSLRNTHGSTLPPYILIYMRRVKATAVGWAYWTNGTATLPNKRDMNIELPWIEFMPSKQLAFESVCLKDHGLMGLKVTAL